MRIPTTQLLSSTEAALVAAGLATASADIIARGLVASQRDGRPAHGISRLPLMVRSLRDGEVNADAEPQLTRTRPAVLQADAQCGFALPAISAALPALAIATREHGVASLSVVNAHGIIGALWTSLERLASEHGLAVIAFCNSPAFVCPAGGVGRVFGTNPLGFAWPRAHAPPLVVDFACSASSRGDMQQAARQGERLPPGSALDARGRPTTDAAAGLQGFQLPFGGHKGACVALLVELLAAAWTGTELGCEASDPMNRGLVLLALDLGAHGRTPAAAQASAERLFAAVRAAGGRLPADGRYHHRRRGEALGSTVAVSAELLAELEALEGFAAADRSSSRPG